MYSIVNSMFPKTRNMLLIIQVRLKISSWWRSSVSYPGWIFKSALCSGTHINEITGAHPAKDSLIKTPTCIPLSSDDYIFSTTLNWAWWHRPTILTWETKQTGNTTRCGPVSVNWEEQRGHGRSRRKAGKRGKNEPQFFPQRTIRVRQWGNLRTRSAYTSLEEGGWREGPLIILSSLTV